MASPVRSRRTAPRAAVLVLTALLAGGGARVVAADEPADHVAGRDPELAARYPALDPELHARVLDPAAPELDVFLILRAQPAADVAEEERPRFVARIDAVWSPVRAALAGIAPLLPDREERAAMSIGRQIALENELLRVDQREMRRDARREVASLLARMRATILAEAWARCSAEQELIAAHVRDLPGGRVLARTCVLNALVVRVRPGDLPALLEQHPGIARVALSGVREPFMDVSAPVVNSDEWTSNDIDGSGQKVAIVDTGVDSSHPALLDDDDDTIVAAEAVRLGNGALESNFDDDDTDTDDLHGHGTHIAGTIASRDSTYGGVAPGAPLMSAKCFYKTTSGGGAGLDPDIISATDWALSNGASVLSLSFGGAADTDGSEPLTRFYDAVVQVTGVTVAVAAGNAGSGTNTVLSPGDAFNALTVGAYDDKGTTSLSDDVIAGFSSRGATDDGRRKPDLSAPGVSIRSANNTWEGSGADFVNKSGTSMATPHVAAGMALLLDHESDWQPEALKALLLNSTRNASPAPSTPDQVWGYGGLDLGRAYAQRDRVETATLSSAGTSVLYFVLSQASAGDRATLVWNRSVSYAAGGRSAGAGTAKSLVDLDLLLYDEDGEEDDASESEDDPVEQVEASAALGSGVLRVERVGSFPSGQSSLSLALASAAALTPVEPPALSLDVTAPAIVAGGAEVTVSAKLSNAGGLPAIAPALEVTLPTGWTLAAGQSAMQSVADIDSDGDRTATWTVIAPAASGSATITVDARSTCWGDTFESAEDSVAVYSDDTPPTIDAGSDEDLYATTPFGRDVLLRATATDDSGGAVTLSWDTDGDGDFDDEGGSAHESTPLVAFSIGTHDVSVRAVDAVGNAATDDLVVRILDNPPDADAGTDVELFEGDVLSLDGSGSSDVEGALEFAWDLGDGSSATGRETTHTYTDQGTFTVTLTVTDSVGQSRQDTLTATVSNADPVADAGPDRVVGEGREITIHGSGSDPGASDSLTFLWTFSDGTTATAADVTHAFREDGQYTATLTVTDDDGAVASDSVAIEVRNVAPEVFAGPPLSIDEGDSVLLSGNATDPGVDDVLTYEWNIDGVHFPGAEITYVFERDGNRRAYLAVTDDDGDTGFASVFVAVRNVPPTVTLPAQLRVGIGSLLVHELEPWDASPVDRAGLSVAWRIEAATGDDGTPLLVAAGVGGSVVWDADRRLEDARLVVTVSDDDTSVERVASLRSETPAIADTLPPLLDSELEAAVEKKVLAALFGAHQRTPPDAKRNALRKALRSVRRARKTVAGAGLEALERALAAIEEDLAAGRAPPPPEPSGAPAEAANTAELLRLLPGAGMDSRSTRRLAKALLKLRDAERRGKSASSIAKWKARAAKVAAKLPAGPVAAGFQAALSD